MLTTAIILIAILATFAGWRARNPTPSMRMLIANTDERHDLIGLYLLRGLPTFVDPCADRTTNYSARYSGTPYTLETAGWAIGLASVFVVSALYLGWAFFDITTIGNWSFFKPDIEWSERALHTAAAVIPVFFFVALAADAEALQNRFLWGSEEIFGFLHRTSFFIFLFVHAYFFGNTGLLLMSGGLSLLIASERGKVLIILIAIIMVYCLGLLNNLGVAHGALLIFILLVAIMTWIAFVAAVEILCALRWYGSENITILLGLFGIALSAIICAWIIPFIMVVLLFAIMVSTPESIHNDWVNLVGIFREGGLPAAAMLAFACAPPLLPALWFIGRGLGTAIARSTPMMRQFITDLSCSKGYLTQSEFYHLLRNHRRAYAFGYSIASIVTMGLFASALWLLSHAFMVTS